MASVRASTMMLLPPSMSMPASFRDKAREDAKDYQRVIEASLRGSAVPEFRYILQELIGKGSYGRVYLAKRKTTGQEVAIKIINIEALDAHSHAKPLGIEDAQKEIDILARLRDFPTVNVNVFVEAFPVHEHLCIVSEYCSGGSLTTLRRATRGNRLDEKYLRPVARELAFALRSVHAAGIVHRDVKGSNVMVDEDGKIQLIDFGVAGIVMTTMPEDKRKTVIGTPHWMPPELQWDKPEISHGTEVDVWAYGITLYECAMGQPPNASIINPRQLRQIIRKTPVRLTEQHFTPELRDLIEFVLEPDVTKRPSMEQVCQHPYIVGTEAAHPVSILQDLVQEYLKWESAGGVRHSLFLPGGAAKVESNQTQAGQRPESDEGWNFSATDAFRRRMSQIDPSFNYSYDPFSPAIPEDMVLSNSPPPPDDEDFEEPWTARLDTNINNNPAPDNEIRAGTNITTQATASAERGEKQLMSLFDPNTPEYRYTYGKASDLPLRHGGEASFHRQELSVSSNNGRGPTINLEDVPNPKRSTMAWTWNEGLNAGPSAETSNRNSDFFADLPTGHRAPARQSDFFGDLVPPPRPGLDRAATMPIATPAGDNRTSTLDLDALLGPTNYNASTVSSSSSFVGHSSKNHSFEFPTNGLNTSYGGTTVSSFVHNDMEEPLDSFEAEMAATATDVNNFTMRPATYHERNERGHTATTSQLPADLVSSPAGSSFDDVTRELPAITSQFQGSFDAAHDGNAVNNGVARWQARLHPPGWMNGENGDETFTSIAAPANGDRNFTGGAGPVLPYVTRCHAGRPPVLGFPEALDARANSALQEEGLRFQIQQTINLLDRLSEQIDVACDEELAHLDQIHGSENDSESGEDEDEDAGYDGGQEYADGTETEDGDSFVTENDFESGTATGEESSRSV